MEDLQIVNFCFLWALVRIFGTFQKQGLNWNTGLSYDNVSGIDDDRQYIPTKSGSRVSKSGSKK
jgi:hypothetical protein